MPKDVNNQLIDKVTHYLNTDAAKNFTAGEVDGLLEAISGHLPKVVGSFVGVMGDNSKDALNNGDIKEFSKSIARALISQMKLQDGSFIYNDNKVQDALDNFKKLDKSKYDKDGVSIAGEILAVLQAQKTDLNYNNKFNPLHYSTVLITQMVPSELITNDSDKEKASYLIAGIIAKIAGQKSQLVDQPQNLKAAILAAHDGAIKVLEENPALFNKSKEELMQIGKSVGKNTRNGDINSIQNRIESSLASHQVTAGLSQSTTTRNGVPYNVKHNAVIGKE